MTSAEKNPATGNRVRRLRLKRGTPSRVSHHASRRGRRRRLRQQARPGEHGADERRGHVPGRQDPKSGGRHDGAEEEGRPDRQGERRQVKGEDRRIEAVSPHSIR